MGRESVNKKGQMQSALRLALVHASAQNRASIRQWSFTAAVLAVPFLLVAFFIFPNLPAQNATRLRVFLTQIEVVVLTMVVLFHFGVSVATERASGWEAFLRTLPVGFVTRMVGRLLAALSFSVVAGLIPLLLVLGVGLYAGVNIFSAAWDWGAWLIVLVLSVLPLSLLGAAIGYTFQPQGAAAVVNLLYLGLAFLGGLFVPPDQLPGAIRSISPYFPTRQIRELALAPSLGDGVATLDLVGLAIWSIIFGLFFFWRYQSDEGKTYR